MSSQNEIVAQEMRHYDQFITNWLKKFLGDIETAADLKQSVFVQVLEYAREQEIDNPKALMFKIARNLAVNELRRRKRFEAVFVPTDDYDSPLIAQKIASETPTPEETTSSREDMRRFTDALNSLPPRQRQAMILSRMHGCTYRTIAQKLGVSESSVEKYMVKALKTLREKLDYP
ncbi:MAG: sigma-70 family RNA polymerase sigma factor [Pseudomonadota bacterium]